MMFPFVILTDVFYTINAINKLFSKSKASVHFSLKIDVSSYLSIIKMNFYRQIIQAVEFKYHCEILFKQFYQT